MAERPLNTKDRILGGRDLKYQGKDAATRELAGVYGLTPTFTPKYHTGHGAESILKQARFIIPLPSKDTLDRIVKTAGTTAIARKILRVLTVRAKDVSGASASDAYYGKPPTRSPTDSKDSSTISGAWGGYGYVDFWLTGISLQFREQVQVVDLNSKAYAAYYHGIAAPSISLTGSLLNTVQNNWWANFLDLYLSAIRGTKTALFKQPLILILSERRYHITLNSLSQRLESNVEELGSFSLQGLVAKIENVDNFRSTDPTDLSLLAKVNSQLTGGGASSAIFEIPSQDSAALQNEVVIPEEEDLSWEFDPLVMTSTISRSVQLDSNAEGLILTSRISRTVDINNAQAGKEETPDAEQLMGESPEYFGALLAR